MKFTVIAIFPEVLKVYAASSILKRAQIKRIISIELVNLRKFVKDPYKTVDGRPYGGGPGMVLKAEPILKAVESAVKKSKVSKLRTLIIVTAANGKQFSARDSARYAKEFKHIVLIAGHYEGVDARVIKALNTESYKHKTMSIGPYVLTGGELAAMVMIDSVSRHILGVLGKEESLEEKRGLMGTPVYTRPEVFRWPIKHGKNYIVPKVLRSGNHKEIDKWRKKRGAPLFES